MNRPHRRPSLHWLRARGALWPSAELFADCHRRIDAMLEPAIRFWKRVVDRQHGGFFGLVDYAGRPRLDADKHLVQQVRHLWSFCEIHRFEDDSSEIRAICDHQLDFVRERLYVAESAGFHAAVGADGTPREDTIHHYSLAFGILALANYARAFPSSARGKDALAVAKRVFERMVERSYDPANGFDETVYAGRWCEDAKEINTQMHLMEAATELLEAARTHQDASVPAIEAILDRQLTLVVTKAIATRGRRHFCSRGYAKDWTLVNDWEVDLGHDIETVYLAMATARTLGREHEPGLVERVVELGRSTTELAYDRELGKWFYSADPRTGAVRQRSANVWTNFEALNGLSTLYRMTGDAMYLDRFERVLAWLETKQRNPEVGEWYYSVDDQGRRVDHDVFGNDCAWMTFAWKSSYHSLRALLTQKRWLEDTYSLAPRR